MEVKIIRLFKWRNEGYIAELEFPQNVKPWMGMQFRKGEDIFTVKGTVFLNPINLEALNPVIHSCLLTGDSGYIMDGDILNIEEAK